MNETALKGCPCQILFLYKGCTYMQKKISPIRLKLRKKLEFFCFFTSKNDYSTNFRSTIPFMDYKWYKNR